jgi:hypothetical protein
MLRFSPEAVLVLPGAATDCEAALVRGSRDSEGRPQVLCSFYPGLIVRALPPGVEVSSALFLTAGDARALARELERAAEDAEEQ